MYSRRPARQISASPKGITVNLVTTMWQQFFALPSPLPVVFVVLGATVLAWALLVVSTLDLIAYVAGWVSSSLLVAAFLYMALNGTQDTWTGSLFFIRLFCLAMVPTFLIGLATSAMSRVQTSITHAVSNMWVPKRFERRQIVFAARRHDLDSELARMNSMNRHPSTSGQRRGNGADFDQLGS